MEHTKGPWIVEEASDKRIEISSSCNFGIADVWALDGKIQHEEMRANAHLISAAPDLLKLARYALEYIDAIPKGVEFPTMPGFDRDWAEDVIAKATNA